MRASTQLQLATGKVSHLSTEPCCLPTRTFLSHVQSTSHTTPLIPCSSKRSPPQWQNWQRAHTQPAYLHHLQHMHAADSHSHWHLPAAATPPPAPAKPALTHLPIPTNLFRQQCATRHTSLTANLTHRAKNRRHSNQRVLSSHHSCPVSTAHTSCTCAVPACLPTPFACAGTHLPRLPYTSHKPVLRFVGLCCCEGLLSTSDLNSQTAVQQRDCRAHAISRTGRFNSATALGAARQHQSDRSVATLCGSPSV